MINGSENGLKQTDRVIRVCDRCGKIDETTYCIVLRGRRRRDDNIDLCWVCANKVRVLPRGQNHGAWRHGLNSSGYMREIDSQGVRKYSHVVMMEKILGRKLNDDEVVHHIDYDKTNNDVENLWLYKVDEHARQRHNLQKLMLSKLGEWVWFSHDEGVYVLEQLCPISHVLPEVTCLPTPRNGKRYQRCSYNSKERRFHDVLMEIVLGRQLYRNEVVHHIDGNKLNNNLNNLAVMTRSQHRVCHYSLETCGVVMMKRGLVIFENGTYVARIKGR